ncbi:MAG TPA: exosortase A [Azonexus sp.]|nr:exosortase A [Azonexus sp.]
MNPRIGTKSLTQVWQTTLALIALSLAIVGYSYRGTLAAMAEIWWRSETYTHGLLVPMISAWIVWGSRHRIANMTPQVWLWPLAPLALAVFAWVLGELTAVNALTQFSVVTIAVLCCVTLLGKSISRELAFPFLFLFFAVPIGDFLMPRLMEWTADFTVIAVRFSGIPVYREGQNFVIPSGNWSVVEACSGIRYLIASLTIGTLFAYLTYTSLKRRLIFVAISILVPIIANWLRAYMIVMLGHLSGNKLAVGVDHLIYGWIFFGVVIAIMFAIGMRWAEPDTQANQVAKPNSATGATPQSTHLWGPVFAILLVAGIGPLLKDRVQNLNIKSSPRLVAPAAVGSWQAIPHFVDLQPHFDQPSAELHQAYQSADHQAALYVAYYRNQDFERKLVTSTNVLVPTTNPKWQIASSGDLNIANIPSISRVKTFELMHKSGTTDDRYIAWQWYWINGHLTTNDIKAKFLTAWSMLSGQGDDSAVIILYAPKANGEQALTAFSEDMAEAVSLSLARARTP